MRTIRADGRAAGPCLTPREKEILWLLGEGLSNKAIANRLAVSDGTVKSHLGKAFRKLGVRNRLQALRLVVEEFR